MKNFIYILVVLALISLAGWYAGWFQQSDNSSLVSEVGIDMSMEMSKIDKPTDDVMMKTVVDTEMTDMNFDTRTFDYSGALVDVTSGQSIRGLSTSGLATGQAKSTFINGQYDLFVSFNSLPDPENNEFYEGWIVRKSPFDVVSTGPVQKVDGQYINTYISGTDLTDHSFYVLTLEPDDNNPAPADHILEGTMVK